MHSCEILLNYSLVFPHNLTLLILWMVILLPITFERSRAEREELLAFGFDLL